MLGDTNISFLVSDHGVLNLSVVGLFAYRCALCRPRHSYIFIFFLEQTDLFANSLSGCFLDQVKNIAIEYFTMQRQANLTGSGNAIAFIAVSNLLLEMF